MKVNEVECQGNRLIENGTSHAGTSSSLSGIIVKMRFRGDFRGKMTLSYKKLRLGLGIKSECLTQLD